MVETRTIPQRSPVWMRATGLLIGFLFLVWLPFEDVNVLFTVVLASTIGIWLLLRFLLQKEFSLQGFAVSGAVAGLCVSPLAITMMAFKSGIHAHGFSDFVLPQINTVLAATPWFIVGGLLLGSAIFFLVRQA